MTATHEKRPMAKRRGGAAIFAVSPAGAGAYRVTAVTFSGRSVASVEDLGLLTAESAPEILAKAGYRRGMETVFVLPRADALLKWLRLPATDARQIARMMPHEAAAVLPWPEQDTQLAYRVQETESEGYSHVLLIAAPKATLDVHIARLKAMGLALTRVEVSTVAFTALLGAEVLSERSALAYRGESGGEYLRFDGPKVSFSRGVGAAETESGLLATSFALDRRKHGADADVQRVILAGDVDTTDSTALPHPIALVPLSDVPLPVLNGAGPLDPLTVAGVAGAIAAREDDPHSNLAPESELRGIRRRALLRTLATLAAGLAWVVVVLVLMAQHFIASEEAYIAKVSGEIAQLRDEVGGLEDQSRQLEVLGGELLAVGAPLRLVLDLYDRTPVTIAISHMQYDSRGAIVLGGEAPTYAQALEFLSILAQSPQVTEVKLVYSAQPDSTSGDIVDFKVTAQLRNAP